MSSINSSRCQHELVQKNMKNQKDYIFILTLEHSQGVWGTIVEPLLDFYEFCVNICHGYVIKVQEFNDDIDKNTSVLHDIENQGQTLLFCITFHICGSKRYTNLILESILTFSKTRKTSEHDKEKVL